MYFRVIHQSLTPRRELPKAYHICLAVLALSPMKIIRLTSYGIENRQASGGLDNR